jgi:uncharacterized damage-inducible protein DinB
MTDNYRRLFDYEAWANRETLASLRAAANPPEKARKLLGHIVGAGRLWISRIEGAAKPPAVWPDLSLEECARGIEEMRGRWSAFLERADPAELSRAVGYTNSKGERWESSVADILTHVVLHGTYHRGQIASRLRDAGGEPAYTDFIEAARRGKIG